MDKKTAQKLSNLLEVALKDFCKENNVTIAIRGGKFDTSSYFPKLVIMEQGSDGSAITPELTDLRRFHPSWEGKTFTANFRRYEITGFKPRNHRYPVIAKGPDGKSYKFPEDVIRRGLND